MPGRPVESAGGPPRPVAQSQTFPSADLDERDFAGDGSAGDTAPRPILSKSGTTPQPATGSYLSSSWTRTPARSFFHHASHGSIGTPEYSSQGVRSKTQQLSMHALSDTGSLRTTPILPPNADPQDNRASSRSTHKSWDLEGPRDSPDPSSPAGVEDSAQASAIGSPMHRYNSSGMLAHDSATFGPPKASQRASPRRPRVVMEDPEASGSSSESSPLLPQPRLSKTDSKRRYGATEDVEDDNAEGRVRSSKFVRGISDAAHSMANGIKVAANPKLWDKRAVVETAVIAPVRTLPAVFLGLLLNVLDGLSYGIILFPLGEPIFDKLGIDGLSMFFVSCIVSQLVYSLGGSTFKGAVGSEMIEVVPFFHKMTYVIMGYMVGAEPKAIVATVVVAYALSSILTGLIFLILGLFKLGNLVSFFPRNILNGCIGGVGFFLFVTGIEVSARLDGNLEYSLTTLEKLFQSDTVWLWITPLLLSILFMLIKHYYDHPALMPMYIILITATFHIVVAAAHGLNLDWARRAGWVFEKPESGVPFYHFYSLYDFSVVDWSAIIRTIPTMFALSFFGIIHVPINVPALALSAKEDDVNINRELIAHGMSNALSGFVGSIQNYLVYVNSVMFMDHGGNSRLAGILLAIATTAVWMAGPGLIGYVPILVVGTLIFYLGIDLLKEALWDTLGKLRLLEYLTIVIIVLIMGIYDFVWGVLAGIMLACLTFVVQTARTPAIRAKYTGVIAQSTVRRPPLHRKYLQEVGQQIYVAKIAGHLFFGTIVSVEEEVRRLVDEESFRMRPIRYVVLDFVHVIGIDYSAAEVLVRLNRILFRRNVTLVISSVSLSDTVGAGLSMVGLFQPAESNDDHCPPPQRFETLNKALEWCENELLAILHERTKSMGTPREAEPVSISPPKTSETNPFDMSAFNSPRRELLHQAANMTLQGQSNVSVDENNMLTQDKWKTFKQPIPLMLHIFQDLSDKDLDFWHRGTKYFERREFGAGTVLYSRGDDPDGFYLIERGSLRADYFLEQGQYHESIQAGTTCGELPFFSQTGRTSNMAAETETVAWVLTRERWQQLEGEHPAIARELLRVCLKLTQERMNAVTSHIIVTAS